MRAYLNSNGMVLSAMHRFTSVVMSGSSTSMHDLSNFVGIKSIEQVESEVAMMAAFTSD